MPLQNRVTPTGEIVADPARGTLMGNRGILHDARGRLGAARWRHPHWVCCRLAFKDRRRTVMAPGRYTELFFLDEATALAAGHRPCCECRRQDFRTFQVAWWRAFDAGSDPSAAAMDRALHVARVEPRTRRQVRFEAPLGALPDGAFVLLPEDPSTPLLIFGDRLLPWRPSGYGRPRPRAGASRALVLTPRPTIAVLRAGYAPALHPSAPRALGSAL
ncbi:MAG TPA: hypothetical protein VE597_08455 [Geminicoccaceae bacterium]|jgi:hypothetical protein|nr:hypothetical protein [Geminicoccaceae bacterium]